MRLRAASESDSGGWTSHNAEGSIGWCHRPTAGFVPSSARLITHGLSACLPVCLYSVEMCPMDATKCSPLPPRSVDFDHGDGGHERFINVDDAD